MKIWMIWIEDDSGEFHWMSTAWDDDSTAENHEGWQEAVKKARDEFGAERVRILSTDIDFDAVVAAFLPAEVKSGPVEVHP